MDFWEIHVRQWHPCHKRWSFWTLCFGLVVLSCLTHPYYKHMRKVVWGHLQHICRDLTHLHLSQLSPKLPFCLFVLRFQLLTAFNWPVFTARSSHEVHVATSIACYGDCYFTVLLKTLGLSALKARSRIEQQKVSQATRTHCREWHARLATWL